MKPFDLEAAKRGEPIKTRAGQPAKFIAHVPDAHEDDRLVIQIGRSVHLYCESGNLTNYGCGKGYDLFMVPQKRTVWVNLYQGECSLISSVYSTQESADALLKEVGARQRIGNRAWPLEIEE